MTERATWVRIEARDGRLNVTGNVAPPVALLMIEIARDQVIKTAVSPPATVDPQIPLDTPPVRASGLEVRQLA